jgi:peptide/nickel transport system permease protein
MLSEALALLMFAPHVAIAPGVFITLAVFAFNILGDALRDVLDPRLRMRG